MTETDWLACSKPGKMLNFLIGKVSHRKLHLFGVASCRQIWHLLRDDRSQRAVETAERYLEGNASQKELYRARCRSHAAYWEYGKVCSSPGMPSPLSSDREWEDWYARGVLFAAYNTTCCDDPIDGDSDLGFFIGLASGCRKASGGIRASLAALRECQPVLLRDLGGNPFRPAALSPAVLAWNDALVVRLAQAAYDERHLPEGTLDNERLSILADALEEAGCTDADILDHLRGPGPHVRGCWPVDLCLRKS